ncbi:hypothetical protein [Winogradskyella pacifica]|uniref:Uncharacterized protein n=1 Tax=Winogradskyella pacifica TaxID=664642 RepID=A0A3D9N5L5_9FLAO|nr:hypothetical protein [Winogradskyella pacifica]REE27175.1 hypothetical protein DFQ09_1012 [Winogradskyella pacifica]
MNRNINLEISNPKKFISDIENKKFVEIPGSDIWDLGFSNIPHHNYTQPKDFPNCCEYHKSILSNLNDWFNTFPNCCDNHKALLKKKWFKKELYTDIPNKVLNSVSYTSSFIEHSIEKDNWYKEITDYIDYIIDSFGTPSIGGERFFSVIEYWVKNSLEIPKEIEWKRNQLLDYFKSKTEKKVKKNTDLNLLHSTFQNWIKFIPEIPVFNSIKIAYKGKLPMNLFLYDGEYNRFTGLTTFKGRTQSELIEIIVNHTKKILFQLTSENVYKSLNLTDKEKYEIQIIAEKHKLGQLLLLENFSKNELKYIKVLKKWLKNEKGFISELKPIFDKISEQNFHSFLIQQIFFFGQSLEKLKHLHSSFGEEDFRDYFLPHLTQISKKHIATGETFNKKGKTDILIQDMNAINTFVAECKLWKGKSYLSSAINQLIERYVLWRDEKIALIIFNKDNKDFAKVIEIAKETIEEHELFESFVEEKFKTIITYKFKHSEDITKIVTLELILFNCYKQ